MTRPNPDRAAWLLHDVAHGGRLKIDTPQYVELQEEARALKEERDDARRALEQERAHLRMVQVPEPQLTRGLLDTIRQLEAQLVEVTKERNEWQRRFNDGVDLDLSFLLAMLEALRHTESATADEIVGLVRKVVEERDELCVRVKKAEAECDEANGAMFRDAEARRSDLDMIDRQRKRLANAQDILAEAGRAMRELTDRIDLWGRTK